MISQDSASLNEFGSIITMNAFNHHVFKHQVFALSKRFAIGANAVDDIVVDLTDVETCTNVTLPFSVTGYDAGPIFCDLYEGAEYTAATGTAWAFTDRNRCDPIAAKTTAALNPTITEEGVKSELEFFIPSNGVPARTKLAGETGSDLIFKLKAGTVYLFRFTNTSANTGTGLIEMDLFEV